MRRTILVSSHIFYHAKTLNLLLLLHTIQFSTTHLLHTFAMEIHRILQNFMLFAKCCKIKLNPRIPCLTTTHKVCFDKRNKFSKYTLKLLFLSANIRLTRFYSVQYYTLFTRSRYLLEVYNVLLRIRNYLLYICA